MKEQIISFETAKLAEEKGYTREVTGISFFSARRNYYNEEGELNGDCTNFIKDVLKYGREKAKVKHKLYPATSQSLLQKWLREEHNIAVYNKPLTDNSGRWSAYVDDMGGHHHITYYIYEATYEEALEKGLQEALKLI